MILVRSLGRLLILVLFFAFFPSLLAGAWIGLKGILGLVGLSFLLLLFLLTGSEKGLIWIFQASPAGTLGLQRSLAMALANRAGELSLPGAPLKAVLSPRLLVFSDPFPLALGFRSLGGVGTILLSQGLIAAFNEAELQAAIKHCLGETRQAGVIMRTLCALFALFVLSLAPRPWKGWVFGSKRGAVGRVVEKEQSVSSFSAIVFLLIFPFCQLFLKWGEVERIQIFDPTGTGRFRSFL